MAKQTGTGDQIIQTSRGNLIVRNDTKVLARGELFIQTKQITAQLEVGTAKGAGKLHDGENYIYDLVTQSYIHTYFEGDLFAGSGEYGKVYSLGSGGALKWAGVTTGATWNELKAKAKLKPNFIYMYAGATSVTPESGLDNLDPTSAPSVAKINVDGAPLDRNPGTRGANEILVEDRYVAASSEESQSVINPGDLFFYSPVYDEIVVIHLSHSTDALTNINQFALISNSMKTYLSEKFGKLTEGVLQGRYATLKDFLDGPARHYQYLLDGEGWKAVEIDEAATQPELAVKAHEIDCLKIGPEDLEDDFDGAIHYIPFTNGKHRIPYAFEGEESSGDVRSKYLHEGDLILTLPAEDGGVYHKVISLYGKLLDMLSTRNLDFQRADAYADSLWKTEADKGYGQDDDEFKADITHTIIDYIKRLYLTKVDIDPHTKKIVSSQLPDFLLGAPKYMGVLSEEDANILASILNPSEEEDAPVAPTNAHDVALQWLANFANIDKNADTEVSDEDEPHETGDTGEYDTKLQVGSYWIWQGGHFVIDGLEDFFVLNDKDDYDSTATNELEGTGEFVHALENGDWVIYNGTKFDIIDNTSAFVGIIVHNTKLSGTPEFKENKRTDIYKPWSKDEGFEEKTTDSTEVKLEAESVTSLKYSAPNTVIFKDDKADATPYTDEDHLPIINNKGVAYNSRIGLGDSQASMSLEGLDTAEEHAGLNSIKFLFSKYLNEAYEQYTEVTGVSTTEDLLGNQKMFGESQTSVLHYVQHGFGATAGGAVITSLDFKEFTFTQDEDVTNHIGNYRFEIKSEADPVLQLPTHSGTLATERYVDNGFVVVKKIIEDLYDEIMKQTTSGRIDWLQTLVPAETPTDKKIYDSRIKQILSRTTDENDEVVSAVDTLGFGFYLVKAFDGNDVDDANSLYTKLVVKKVLTENDGPIDLKLFTNNGTTEVTYNPSTLDTGAPAENVLPNHSGTLLNNHSVIDGGEYL